MSKPSSGENCTLSRHLKEVSMHDKCDLKAQLAGALFYGLDYPGFTPQAPDLASFAQLLESIATAGETDLLPEARAICLNCPQLANCNVGSMIKDSQSTTSLAGFSVPNQSSIQQKTSLFSSLGNKFWLTATALGFWRLCEHLALGHRWIPVAFFSKKAVE